MSAQTSEDYLLFRDAVQGLEAGDFSRLAPLFDGRRDGDRCRIIEWYEAGFLPRNRAHSRRH